VKRITDGVVATKHSACITVSTINARYDASCWDINCCWAVCRGKVVISLTTSNKINSATAPHTIHWFIPSPSPPHDECVEKSMVHTWKESCLMLFTEYDGQTNNVSL
jgi:hypothetical protein